jgi:hypothetical protein
MLTEAGHQVVTPFEADIAGADDLFHFEYACQHQLTLVTKDPNDFEELHQQNKNHFGILAICEEADHSKNMSYNDVVRAINNLTSTNVPLVGQFYVLNHWRW